MYHNAYDIGVWLLDGSCSEKCAFCFTVFQVSLEHPIAIGPIGTKHFLGWSIESNSMQLSDIRYIPPKKPSSRGTWGLGGSKLEVWRFIFGNLGLFLEYQRCNTWRIIPVMIQWLRTMVIVFLSPRPWGCFGTPSIHGGNSWLKK